VTEHPGEEFPPAVDPDVEPQPDERRTPDYDTEPEPDITPHADQADAVDYTEAEPTTQEQAVEREDGVHPLVEETMERLDGLRERPVSEHAEVYADLHERLQTALVEADAEHGDRG